MRASDKKVPVSISIPYSMDQFFERARNKIIEVGSERVELTKTKNDLINRALEYALAHAEEWLK
jgi:hypothetical protein